MRQAVAVEVVVVELFVLGRDVWQMDMSVKEEHCEMGGTAMVFERWIAVAVVRDANRVHGVGFVAARWQESGGQRG